VITEQTQNTISALFGTVCFENEIVHGIESNWTSSGDPKAVSFGAKLIDALQNLHDSETSVGSETPALIPSKEAFPAMSCSKVTVSANLMHVVQVEDCSMQHEGQTIRTVSVEEIVGDMN
jgi:hypothetical protein